MYGKKNTRKNFVDLDGHRIHIVYTIGSISVLDMIDYEDQFVGRIVLVLIAVIFLTWAVSLICNIKSVSP